MRTALVLALLLVAAPGQAQRPAQPAGLAHDEAAIEAFVDALLARMTLEEKLGQLTQTGGRGESVPGGPAPTDAEVRAGRVGSFLYVTGAAQTCAAQRIAVEQSRLGIPLLFGFDVIHGYRTAFPVPLAEAASWDPDLARRTAAAAAREAAADGVHWAFAPMVDVARDPRWGRIMEGAGEDPVLGSAFADARVRGFQGDALGAVPGQHLDGDATLLACAKHFAAYGGAEAGRDYNISPVPVRTLREVYLPPFEAAVRAGAQTFMAAFNEVDGVPATGNRWLMTDVLRGDWGFSGFVVSDYAGVAELIHHGVAADSLSAATQGLGAGVDMEMVTQTYLRNIGAEVTAGRFPMAAVDEAVRRILRVKARAGLFEHPFARCEAGTVVGPPSPEARRLAREAAARSIVLLKNEGGLLPLSRSVRRLAVVGSLAADSASALGNWAGPARPGEAVTVLDGIRAALPGTDVTYAPGYTAAAGWFETAVPAALSRDTTAFAEAAAVARSADAVVLVVGEHRELSGEAASRTDLGLPGVQMDLVRRILALGRPVVVVLMNGRPLVVPDLAAEAPAILEAWQLGTEMGSGVADVLVGDVNPAGRLPATFPRSVGQIPVYYAHRSTGRPAVDGEAEKYVSRYLDSPNAPLFPFGYGLSYTTFAYSGLRLSAPEMPLGGEIAVSVDVTNTGTRAGDEVVQLYVRDDVRSVTPPVRELKGFERVAIAPGETRTVTFRLPASCLRFWGLDGRWTVEPGGFHVVVGPSSAEGLEATFRVMP